MKPSDYRVLIRGAGELASGTAHHLYTQGFQNILMLERRYPKAVRRQVCFSEAILDGTTKVQGVVGRYVRNVDEAEVANEAGAIAIAALDLDEVLHSWQPKIFIEAAMLRKNWGLKREIAPVVIALGPGYVARKDCDAVVETVRGPQVGAVLDDTGERLRDEPPAEIMGYGGERAVKAVRDGIFFTQHRIGGQVDRGERIGTVVSVYGVEDFRQILHGHLSVHHMIGLNQDGGTRDTRVQTTARDRSRLHTRDAALFQRCSQRLVDVFRAALRTRTLRTSVGTAVQADHHVLSSKRHGANLGGLP